MKNTTLFHHNPSGLTRKTVNMINGLTTLLLVLFCSAATAQNNEPGSFLKPVPKNYEVQQAVEIESLFPMFFTGGYHVGVGYRYKKFRVRASVINGGSYNAETAGVKGNSDFKRYYKTSPGIFLGYNIWKNLELYAYVEHHTFQIEQKSTGIKKDLKSVDYGPGIGYQFFIGRHIYLQPAFHVYFRADNSLDFDGQTYDISNIDLSPVIRVGWRLWKQFPKNAGKDR